MTKFVVSIGSLETGFELIGPFDSDSDAQNWADRNLAARTPYYDIVTLHDPDKSGNLIGGIPT